MTDAQTSGVTDRTLRPFVDVQPTLSDLFSKPTTALLATALAMQLALAVDPTLLNSENLRSSTQLSVTIRRDLFESLLDFHRQLAESQVDLPEEAARVLRDNLWRLYD